MKTYHTIKKDGIPFHYRIHGNKFGWTMFVINDAVLNPKLWTTLGKIIKCPFWEQPNDRIERKKFYEKKALELVEEYLLSVKKPSKPTSVRKGGKR